MQSPVKDSEQEKQVLSETLNTIAQKSQQALLHNALSSFSSNLSKKLHEGGSELRYEQCEAKFTQSVIPKSLNSAKRSIMAKFSKMAKKTCHIRQVERKASKNRLETAYCVKLNQRHISTQKSGSRLNTLQSSRDLSDAQADSLSGNFHGTPRNQRCKMLAHQLSQKYLTTQNDILESIYEAPVQLTSTQSVAALSNHD